MVGTCNLVSLLSFSTGGSGSCGDKEFGVKETESIAESDSRHHVDIIESPKAAILAVSSVTTVTRPFGSG